MFYSFPTWAYGPEGQSGIFHRAEDVPEGWADDPAKVASAAPKEPAGPVGVDAPPEAPAIEPLEELDMPPEPAATVRKLGRKKAGALPPKVRADAISAIRSSGGQIEDNASDAEISAALETVEG